MMYYVENGSTYFQISKISYTGSKYKKVSIKWYTRPGMTFMFETKEKIPLVHPEYWIKYDG